jgi:hypothetical protein
VSVSKAIQMRSSCTVKLYWAYAMLETVDCI